MNLGSAEEDVRDVNNSYLQSDRELILLQNTA